MPPLIRDLLIIGSIFTALYVSGLHTNAITLLQRMALQTGLFHAKPPEAIDDGPVLDDAAFRFRFSGTDSSSSPLEVYRGEVIFINVWASWCPPCIAEMPSINRLYNRFEEGEGVRFIMLSLDEEPERALMFMEEYGFELPIHFPASPIPDLFRSGVLPTTYVISPAGEIVYRKEGIAHYDSKRFRQWLTGLAQTRPDRPEP